MDPATGEQIATVGGYKRLGWGRENGRDGVEAYTEIESIAVALQAPGDWLAIK